MHSGIWAALPVKELSRAKQRLAACLSPAERRLLVLAMLQSTSEALAPSIPANQTIVVSSDPEVLEWARNRDLCAQRQISQGLNHAIGEVEQAVMRAGGEVFLVVLPDLPLLVPADIHQMLLCLDGTRQVVLAAGQRGGTHALAIQPPGWLRFAFGPDSLQRHAAAVLAQGGKLSHYTTPGLSFDVDTVDDLKLALEVRPELRRHLAALLPAA